MTWTSVSQNIGQPNGSIVSQFLGGEGNEYAWLKTSDEDKIAPIMAEPKNRLVCIRTYLEIHCEEKKRKEREGNGYTSA